MGALQQTKSQHFSHGYLSASQHMWYHSVTCTETLTSSDLSACWHASSVSIASIQTLALGGASIYIYITYWLGGFGNHGIWIDFPYIGKNSPHWLLFFRGVQTTNQREREIYISTTGYHAIYWDINFYEWHMNDMNGEMNGISWDGELEESDIKNSYTKTLMEYGISWWCWHTQCRHHHPSDGDNRGDIFPHDSFRAFREDDPDQTTSVYY